MTPKSFKSATIGIAILFPAIAILYTIFNALIMLACKTLLYMMQNPFNALLITLGIMALGFIADRLYTKYKNC